MGLHVTNQAIYKHQSYLTCSTVLDRANAPEPIDESSSTTFFLFNKSVLFLFYFSVSDSGVGGDVASG